MTLQTCVPGTEMGSMDPHFLEWKFEDFATKQINFEKGIYLYRMSNSAFINTNTCIFQRVSILDNTCFTLYLYILDIVRLQITLVLLIYILLLKLHCMNQIIITIGLVSYVQQSPNNLYYFI